MWITESLMCGFCAMINMWCRLSVHSKKEKRRKKERRTGRTAGFEQEVYWPGAPHWPSFPEPIKQRQNKTHAHGIKGRGGVSHHSHSVHKGQPWICKYQIICNKEPFGVPVVVIFPLPGSSAPPWLPSPVVIVPVPLYLCTFSPLSLCPFITLPCVTPCEHFPAFYHSFKVLAFLAWHRILTSSCLDTPQVLSLLCYQNQPKAHNWIAVWSWLFYPPELQ